MSESLTVAFVVGVTPAKWARVWGERMPRHPLTLLPTSDALAALDDGTAQVALTRLPVDTERYSAIPLYTEQAVVVAPKDHAIEALDTLALADLADETVLEGEWAATIELVAANVGVTVLPQSVARALSRRDVVARPVTDAPTTQVALVWPIDGSSDLVDEFIGIVRGRTANSSRGQGAVPEDKPASKPGAKSGAKPVARAGQKPRRGAQPRPRKR
jgi:DNA-binding transcriptional LysR family regulator